MKVLVVDDNAALVDNLSEILNDAGYGVLTAATCAAARTVGREGFEVAMVDMRLPDGLGTDLLAELKALQPNAEVILLTGYSTIEAASAAVKAGAFAYLSKPCATDDLLLNVRQAFRQVQAQVDHEAMTRRMQIAEKLATVGTMTAGLSHEIRNPLNSAGLQLTVLERQISKLDESLRPPLLAPLRLVRDEIHRLDHLLQDFLQMARPREPKLQVVDLGSLIHRVLDFMQTDAERRSVTLVRHFERGPTLKLDEDQFRQVVMNLCLNALEASPPSSRVVVATVVDAHSVTMTVDDSGGGVPAALRERIFEPFFTTKPAGSGLGLPIVHAIVAAHGGSLSVADAPAGGGARFIVQLPRHGT